MAVCFFHRGPNRKGYRDWVDGESGSCGFSYMKFHFVRCRLWSFFNPTAGCVWLNWPLGDRDGKCFDENLRNYVLDIGTWCHEDCWPMFVQADCNGELTANQCKDIMRHISVFDIDADIESVAIKKYDWLKNEDKIVNNDIVNDDRVKKLTKYFINGIRHADDQKLTFAWH